MYSGFGFGRKTPNRQSKIGQWLEEDLDDDHIDTLVPSIMRSTQISHTSRGRGIEIGMGSRRGFRGNPEHQITEPYRSFNPQATKLTIFGQRQFPKKELHKKESQNPYTKNKKQSKKEIIKDYTFKGKLYNGKDQIPEADYWKLKKLCANVIDEVDSVSIMYSKNKPVIFFQYGDQLDRKNIHFRDVIRENKTKKTFVDPQLFFRTFQRFYRSIPQEFCLVGKFGLVLADEKNLFKFKGIKNIAKQYQDMKFFYAKKNEEAINFILFNKDMFYVEFTSYYIEEKKAQNVAEYKNYEKFKLGLGTENIKEEDLFCGEEANSGDEKTEVQTIHEEIKNVQVKGQKLQVSQIQTIKNKIQGLMNKSLESYQEIVENKNDEFEAMNKNGNSDKVNEMEKLADQIMELQANIDNFNETTEAVKKQLREYSVLTPVRKYTMLLKRMILGVKQLDSALPIIAKKRQIFNLLDSGSLIILEGETGSGKSTQLPQMLCQYYKIFETQDNLPVLITQPRKLATRTLAQRVASQMDEQVHQFVEYQASCNNRKLNQKSKIIFKLDRLVLDEMTIDPLLKKYCCLVIDEAHERTISIDVILGRIMNILQNRKDFKVIVTSASMDIELFKAYFKQYIGKSLKSIKISGRMYNVQQVFMPLQHVKDVSKKIERLLTENILEPDLSKIRDEYRGHVLIFCTGIDEILSLSSTFEKLLDNNTFKVLSLHGRMSPEQQRQVFNETNKTKIIFSTRIAQTSITINGVKVVIDPGYDREMIYDQKTKISSMQLKHISESSAKQRAGRAGRTNTGYCFRLYTEEQKNKMQSNKTPQIQNMALDTLVLRLKALNIKNVIQFPYVSRPETQGLKISLETMKLVGCLNEQYNLTQIGKLLVKIPIQPFLSRAIIEGIFYKEALDDRKTLEELKLSQSERKKLRDGDLIESIIKILAMTINSSNLYFVKQNEREDADRKKFEQFGQQSGDFSLFLKVYTKYTQLYEQRKSEQLRFWANSNYLSIKTLHQTRQIHKEISNIIHNFHFKVNLFKNQLDQTKKKLQKFTSANDIIIASLTSSFITNISRYSGRPQIGYTLMAQQLPIQLYGTTSLSLQGKVPKWIVCYNLYTSNNGQTFCKVAQGISFDFIKNAVPSKILDAFKILQAENFDPFYGCIPKQLSSLTYIQVLNDYRKRNSYSELNFLNKFTIIFFEQRNSIDIFYQRKHFERKNNENKDLTFKNKMILDQKFKYRQNNDPELIISTYLQQLDDKFKVPFVHDYIGQIKITIVDGYQIKNIEFKKSIYMIKVYGDQQILKFVQYNCSAFGKVQKDDTKLVFFIQGESNRNGIKNRLGLLEKYCELLDFKQKTQKNEKKLKYYEETVDRRNKIPKAKLILTFYAGQAKKSHHLFINYKKYPNNRNQQAHYVYQMKHCLDKYPISIVQNLDNLYEIVRLRPKFQISKNKSGINCYFGQPIDEYQFIQKLNKFKDYNKLGYNFEMPISIIKFRDPEFPYCIFTNRQWEQKITALMRPISAANQKYTVRIWGSYKRNHQDGALSKLEKQMRVNMHAEIQTFNRFLLEKFHEKYDNKNVLGTQKLHAKFQFLQTIASPKHQIFQALSSQYNYAKDQLKHRYPNITIQQSEPKLFRTIYKIFISIRGQNREQLFEPSRKINAIFKPKQKKIQSKYAYRFNRYYNFDGHSVIDYIEAKYKFQLHLNYLKKNSTLQIFCADRDFNNVSKDIDEFLKKIELKTENISYKGKSLVAVEDKIKKIQGQIEEYNKSNGKKNEQKRTCISDVNYQKRMVIITADLETMMQVKIQINSISNKMLEDCELCCGPLQQPYRLFNCMHTFCLLCLFKWIEQSSQMNTQMKCPSCQDRLCVYDMQRMLSMEQFDKLSDIQVSRYVQQNPKYHSCFSPGCEQIFLKQQTQIEKQFQCELCGKWYCTKCKTSHKGFDCDNKMDMKTLQKLGIKKCPKCNTGIEKNKGCNHIDCKTCGIHFCWVCLAYYKTENQCYDHMSKKCKIFPDSNFD